MRDKAMQRGRGRAGARGQTPRALGDTHRCASRGGFEQGLARAILVGSMLLGSTTAEAQPTAADRDPPAAAAAVPSDVAANVNGQPIYAPEVEQRVRKSLGGRDATPEARDLLQAQSLQQLIDRQTALASLEERGEAANEQEVDVEVRRLEDDLSRQEKSLDDYLRSEHITKPILRQQLRWQLSWNRCRAKYLTDENLQRYFERHRREFDGTTLRVAQVLLKYEPDEEHDADLSERLLARARQLRQEILAGSITFADAARKYSQSPSGRDGGELGWIAREGPMPGFFTRAAFELEVAEISEPIASPYGVHLIQCREIRAGDKSWQDARDELTEAVSEYLFRWLVERARPRQNIEFTDTVPHFQIGTRQLVLPPDRTTTKHPKTDQTPESEQAGK